jgi:hypothetical protein
MSMAPAFGSGSLAAVCIANGVPGPPQWNVPSYKGYPVARVAGGARLAREGLFNAGSQP